MKLRAMPCRATQDGKVMVESSDKMWSTGEANGKPLQYSCLENPMNSMNRQKDRTLKDKLTRSVGAQYATRDQWRNNFKRMKRQSQSKNNTHLWMCLVIEERSSAVKSIGTWNVTSMNQGKLEVVKQEMSRVNTDILGISELKWTGMGELTQMTIISTTVGRNPFQEMG